MDQLSAMRAFCRVVETGAFTRAADVLDMPKATVSKLISDLETHLRVRLLNRTTRSVQATSEGAAYYERASVWLRELDDLDSVFAGANARPRGRLAVDASAWVASAVLIPALPHFRDEYPEIQLELSVSDRTIHLVRDNVDCVIRGGELADQTMVGRSLGRSKWLTAASPTYLDRYGIPQHPEELSRGHALVTYHLASNGRPTPFRFGRDGRELSVSGNSYLSVNESNAHLAAGIAGLGIIQSFEWKLRPAIALGELVPILSDWARPDYPFHVLYPSSRFMNMRLRVFIDWLVKTFAELDQPG
jgi:DNA-binding transcriptional LysR family regulator